MARNAEGKRKKTATKTPHSGKQGMPLRFGLVLFTVLVSAVGLFTSAIGIQQTMYDVALSRVDGELQGALDSWVKNDELYNLEQYPQRTLPSDFFVMRYYRDGSHSIINGDGKDAPDLRQVKIGSPPHIVQSLGAKETASEWRVVAGTYEDSIIIVGKRIDHELLLLRRLAVGQLSIGLLVVFFISILGYFIIRRTLRPLRVVEETAKAIAAGDLDRRAPVLPENTEVGALSSSINVMLEQLQTLILELQAKESQMRRFLGDASHELRTPLTSVKGYAELYRSGATENADMVMDKIEEEASRMSLLVEDLLNLTRAEESRFEEKPVDMLGLSLSVVSSLSGAYPDRVIDVDNQVTDIPEIMGDASRMHQVLTNLLVNALKHGGEHTNVRLGIATTETDVVITVSDDGVGLSEEDAAHIFERFYRADTSRTRAIGGSGLGLAIVKSIVESHRGTVVVASTLGQGTTFTVTLPKRD